MKYEVNGGEKGRGVQDNGQRGGVAACRLSPLGPLSPLVRAQYPAG